MQPGQTIVIRTNPATQFRESCAQNAALTLDLQRCPPGQTPALGDLDGGIISPSCALRLRALSLMSVENLAWEVWLWGTDQFDTPTFLDGARAPLGRWAFDTGDAVQIGGTGVYYYYIDGLDISYADFDGTGELHVMLVNRSAAGKSEGDAGAVQLQLLAAPTLGY